MPRPASVPGSHLTRRRVAASVITPSREILLLLMGRASSGTAQPARGPIIKAQAERAVLQAIMLAIEEVKHREWFRDCEIWLYRGAWQEFEPHEIQMAVPLSPLELSRKINAIFKHQSQKDRALFPGADSREFWQRSRDRNMVS